MPKITFKKAFFRIFWKILAKTGPQSLYLCGFPEASVEMKVAPFRALTPLLLSFFRFVLNSRNEGRPFQGIDTTISYYFLISCLFNVEMKVAPFRALTHASRMNLIQRVCVEMKVAPFRALTPFSFLFSYSFFKVEMKVAPFRALTHAIVFPCSSSVNRRNVSRPFQGINTTQSSKTE